MAHLARTFLQGGVLYFSVTMAFHIATLFFTVMGKVITFLLPFAHSDVTTSQTSVIPRL